MIFKNNFKTRIYKKWFNRHFCLSEALRKKRLFFGHFPKGGGGLLPPTCHVSCVTCHVSGVRCQVWYVICHMSCVMYHMSHIIIINFLVCKMLKLIDGGSVINGATLSSLHIWASRSCLLFVEMSNVRQFCFFSKLSLHTQKIVKFVLGFTWLPKG